MVVAHYAAYLHGKFGTEWSSRWLTRGTCGQDLFGVISYSGPAGGHVQGLADSSKFDQNLGQGKNDVPLLMAPPDAEHTFKGEITAPNSKSVAFTPALTLSRSCR